VADGLYLAQSGGPFNDMKKIVLAALLVVGLASPALAGKIQVGYDGSPFGPFQTGSGGEFTYNDIDPDDWLDKSGYASTTSNFGPAGITSFQTFCIEVGEHISGYPSTYNAQLSTQAVMGGSGGPSPDPVSQGTGWLYSQFARGTLAGYDYSGGAGRLASADALQRAIWWLEQEGPDPGFGNVFRDAVLGEFTTEENARGGSALTYGVYAINLWTGPAGSSPDATNKAQDGLFYSVPDGGATIMLLGSALMALRVARRRFSR
jgi:hypothetical protein